MNSDTALRAIQEANAVAERPFGDRGANLEESIEQLNATVEVIDAAGQPYEYGLALWSRGKSYAERTHGDPSANAEAAVQDFEAAAEHLRRRPGAEYADLLGNVLGDLAGAYLARGDAGRALDAARKALHLQNPLRHVPGWLPRPWGVSQMALGMAYQHLRKGNRAQNLRRAIQAFEAAVTVRPADTEPVLHQRTRIALEAARADLARLGARGPADRRGTRTRPDRTDEEIRRVFRSALDGTPAELADAVTVLQNTIDGMPPDSPAWAEAQFSIGALHQTRHDRIGDQADLDAAAEAYQAALRSPVTQGDASRRGGIANNLAVVYLSGPCDPPQLDCAIALLLDALPLRADHPVGWAQTQYNLASAYLRGPKTTAERARQAVEAARAALTILSDQGDTAEEWASAQTNLGLALSMLSFIGRVEGATTPEADLRAIIAALEAGLSIDTRRATTKPRFDAHIAAAVAYQDLSDTLTDRSESIEAEQRVLHHLRHADDREPGRDSAVGPLRDRFLSTRARHAADRDPLTYAQAAFAAAAQAAATADERGDAAGRASAYSDLGHAHLVRLEGDPVGNAAEALRAYRISTEHAGDDPAARATAERGLGDTYRLLSRLAADDAGRTGDAALASDHYDRAVEALCAHDPAGDHARMWITAAEIQSDQYEIDMIRMGRRPRYR